jgi:hypothetical protein
MTGAVNVKVSVFDTDLKYKVKESQDYTAPFENSGIRSAFLHLRSPFLKKRETSEKIERKKVPDQHKK